MYETESTHRRLGRGLASGWTILFGALFVSIMWAYMAPMRLLPASVNEGLVRYSCWLNTRKIPRVTCDAEIHAASTGHVGAYGWWRLAASVAALAFVLWLTLRQVLRRER